MGYDDDYGWPKYVSVAERKAKAAKQVASMKKKGIIMSPVVVEGRTIAKTFWGKAWCDNLESYSDFSNRLPRGRTYARNGSIIDLKIGKGHVKAQVMGSSLYKVTIKIKPMHEPKWKSLVKACSGKIDSLIELLQGKFSKSVMEIITKKNEGLFPKPQEISMDCTCPDFATMCKHVAAVLYGVGATLDSKPEWLFDLRGADQTELIATASGANTLIMQQTGENSLEEKDLSDIFGIELDSDKKIAKTKPSAKIKAKTATKTKPVKEVIKKKTVAKKAPKKNLNRDDS
jgi:uncharacterized Zn finger protein